MNEDQSDLKAALVFCVKMLRTQSRQISELSELLAVLSETVRGLDPTFDDVWKQKKAQLSDEFFSSRQEQLDRFEWLLRSVENGDF